MKRYTIILVVLAAAIGGCAQAPARQGRPDADSKLDEYFRGYCGYTRTGGMGIGFDAAHTFEDRFAQRLATTQDAELKRLFVLFHLYGEVDSCISRLEDGRTADGKGTSSRRMTPEEKAAERSKVLERLDDLSRFDPGDPEGDIAEFRERLEKSS